MSVKLKIDQSSLLRIHMLWAQKMNSSSLTSSVTPVTSSLSPTHFESTAAFTSSSSQSSITITSSSIS
ncbi:unnamed protein product [Rotaria sordida]|uniref:Uncharacterized protein n=1 Tax=Rotaria sordida TaxID=392033 RepID=A0A818WFY1_9BILA|nr:unnamed protein product [Rotaria sordida]